MKMKFFAVMALAVSTVFATTAFAEENKAFPDVDFSTSQGQAIEKMYEAGYLKGYNDGTFRPNSFITRAELTKVFNQVFGYELNEEKDKVLPDFSDIDKNAWYYKDLRIAQTNGYINGFNDGTFRPNENFTRQQTCVVLAVAAGLQTPVKDIVINDYVAPWASNYVKASIADGAFKLENGNFRAVQNITRGEVCQALVKYLSTEEDTSVETSSEVKTTEVSTETTTLSENNGSSSGGGSSSSGGSSGGGSSSSGGSSSGGSSSGGGSSNSGSSSNGGSSSENNKPSIVLNAVQKKSLDNVIKATKSKLVYKVKTQAEKEVVKFMITSMESFVNDESFDLIGAFTEAKSLYNGLSTSEKEDFKDCVYATYDSVDLVNLYDVFSVLL